MTTDSNEVEWRIDVNFFFYSANILMKIPLHESSFVSISSISAIIIDINDNKKDIKISICIPIANREPKKRNYKYHSTPFF